MATVTLAWKKMLIAQLEAGKGLDETLRLMQIGKDRFIQERDADPDFAAHVEHYQGLVKNRPSW